MKNWTAVVIMLAAIVGFGRLTNAAFVDRAWVPIGTPPITPGLQIIEKLPPPFVLNYPGAARIWIYQHRDNKLLYLVTVFYQTEQQGGELVGSGNGVLNNERWRHGPPAAMAIEYAGGVHKFDKMVYSTAGQPAVTVLSQYRFSSFAETTVPLVAKLYGLRDALASTNGAAQINVVFMGEQFLKQVDERLVLDMVRKLSPEIEEQITSNRQ